MRDRWNFWLETRDEVRNWLSSYLITSPLTQKLAGQSFELENLLGKARHEIRFRTGLKMEVGWRDWKYLPSLIRTYDTYTNGMGVTLEPGDTIIDIGAHVGFFSVPLAFHNPGARILAFEPEPRNYAQLVRNRNVNSLSKRDFIVENKAVFGRSGTVELLEGGNSMTGSLSDVGFFKATRRRGAIRCQAVSLDQIFETHRIEKCRLLKVDCEGGEYEIFRSASPETIEKIENLILEAHPARSGHPNEIRASLERKGFQIRALKRGNGCWEFFCRSPYRTE